MRTILNWRFRSPGKRACAGFTLIEFLVAAMLMSVVAIGVTNVFRRSLQLWQRTEEEMRLQSEVRGVMDLIGREFRRAIDVPGIAWSSGEGGAVFSTLGEARRQTGAPTLRILKVTYGLVERENIRVLIRREEDLTSGEGRALPRDTLLTSHPTRIEWYYAYVSGRAHEAIRWEKEWKDSGSIPGGVRIRLTLVDDKGTSRTFSRTLLDPVRELKPWAS
jgi:prepilin-type N-terminal cleavage/methylation domain-containing protein